jgi:mycofactocin system glycosyltransferase
MTTPLPQGFGVAVDASTKQLSASLLFGGSPTRLMRLSAAGLVAWEELRRGPVSSPRSGVLARRLTDAGLAHPRPAAVTAAGEATVIIPVRDRPEMLNRCLTAVGRAYRVIVVDDGSTDAGSVAEVVARHGATLVRRPTSDGPAAARNAGLQKAHSEIVVFLDSDCVPSPGWIASLATHLADPLVAVAAPRIVPLPSTSAAVRYATTCGSLDLGDREARVVPRSRVSYVPTAALVVRRAALRDVGTGSQAFDPALRYGEDVDLIWRLSAAGWRVRYDPAVRVHHDEPTRWRTLLARRWRYGTSAAALARRHPDATVPLVVRPASLLTVAGLLAGNPALTALGLAISIPTQARPMQRAGLPRTQILTSIGSSAWHTWLGLGRYGTQFAAPLVAGIVLAPDARSRPGRRRTRAAAASLLLGPPLVAWLGRPRSLDPIRFVAANVVDNVAYGAGVYAGCLRHRTAAPLRPQVATMKGPR